MNPPARFKALCQLMQPRQDHKATAATDIPDARDDREVPGAHPNVSSSLLHYRYIGKHVGLSDGGRSLRNVDTAPFHANDFLSVSSSSNSNPASPFAQQFTNRALALATRGVDLQTMSEPISSEIQESPFQVHECLGIRWPSSSPEQDGFSEADQNQAIQVGTLVKIVDLKSATNLNGKVGEVLAFDDKEGRFQVKIIALKAQLRGANACSISSLSSANDIKFIKGRNLKELRTTSCSLPVVQRNFM